MGTTPKNKWIIAIKERGEDIFDTNNLTVLEPPQGTYWADPFLAGDYLFYEWYDYNKGVLAYSKLDGLSISEPTVFMERPHHLSFPSVTEIEGEWYMVPEQGTSGELILYKATNFPRDWEPIATVAQGHFGDAVLYKIGGAWFVYTSEGDHQARLFTATSPSGPWNKIRSEDEINSRPAGNIFMWDNQMIRPVQDCRNDIYGRAVVFKEIYPKVATVRTIEPDWMPGLTGTHTFNFNDKYVVVDGRLPL